MLAVDRVDVTQESGAAELLTAPSSAELPDAHESHTPNRRRRREVARKVWAATWPKVAAIALFFGAWQAIVWSGWKPEYVLPGPVPVLEALWRMTQDGIVPEAAFNTFQRAIVGFALATVVGMALGILVTSSKIVRSAIGSMITGVQTMPSIAWFPLAIALYQLSEGAIRFVIVLGAAPAIANGLITGVDHVPPILRRAGRMLGAGRVKEYRHVVLPATLPSFVGGLKQGWAFAWRSLLAGELLVSIARKPSVGHLLQNARELRHSDEMLAWMMVIFVIGLLTDALLFGTLDRAIRRRWGLLTD